MSAEYPITPDLQEAFKEAAVRYVLRDWTPSAPEVFVSIERKSYSFESVCSLVDIFEDPLPGDLLDWLLVNMHYRDNDLKHDVAAKKSYSSAARSLRLMMQRDMDGFRLLEEARKARGLS